MRVGGINAPVALIRIDERSALAVAGSGESSVIRLAGAGFALTATVTPFLPRTGIPRKILKVNSNEVVWLCGNGFSQIIRESMGVYEECVIKIPGVTGVWFWGEKQMVVTHNGKMSVFIQMERGIVVKKKCQLVMDDLTLVFAGNADGSEFIQVTSTAVLTVDGRLDFEKILCGAIGDGLVAVVAFADEQHTVEVMGYSGERLHSIPIPASAQVLAVSKTTLALSSWPEDSIFVFKLETQELIQTIHAIKAVSLALTDTALVVLKFRDGCLFYDLASFAKVSSLHCEGIHYSIIPTNNGAFLIPGERPVLIQDGVVKGVEYHEFTAATSDDRYALICNDQLAIVTP
jgi:hypothetical protein